MPQTEEPSIERFRAGSGDWATFPSPLDAVYEAADGWRLALDGVEKPWLCWNVDGDWCAVQQRLVAAVGWTPIIGFDPRVGAPNYIHSKAVVIDFNRTFGFPTMWMHFPLEFAFLFSPRLAFWHSDLVCRLEKMERLAHDFSALSDGEMSAVYQRGGLKTSLRPKLRRYWELIGCTTQGASRDQFAHGCGWWMRFWDHPNAQTSRERRRRKGYYWDHGAGIMFWQRKCGGRVRPIPGQYVEEGHCTEINNPRYVRHSPQNAKRDLSHDLKANYALEEVCERLGIARFLHDTP